MTRETSFCFCFVFEHHPIHTRASPRAARPDDDDDATRLRDRGPRVLAERGAAPDCRQVVRLVAREAYPAALIVPRDVRLAEDELAGHQGRAADRPASGEAVALEVAVVSLGVVDQPGSRHTIMPSLHE